MLFPLVTPEIVSGVGPLSRISLSVSPFIHPGTVAQVFGPRHLLRFPMFVVIVRGRLFSIGRQYEEAGGRPGRDAPWEGVALGVLLPFTDAGDLFRA